MEFRYTAEVANGSFFVHLFELPREGQVQSDRSVRFRYHAQLSGGGSSRVKSLSQILSLRPGIWFGELSLPQSILFSLDEACVSFMSLANSNQELCETVQTFRSYSGISTVSVQWNMRPSVGDLCLLEDTLEQVLDEVSKAITD